jgi:peptidoglycan-associated lipoprotein
MNRLHIVTALIVIIVVAGTACAKKTSPALSPRGPAPVAQNTPPSSSTPEPQAMVARDTPLSEDDLFARKTLDDLNAERPLGEVLFDYDSWTLDDQARATLQRNARWLMRWSSTRASIEGHCDERGTPEYNLALGERRANTVRDYLSSLGVPAERLVSVSKGKEAPVCNETNDGCWSRNRRGQLVLTAK